MTLAIAWKCAEGAILGADTEFTIPGYYTKYKGNKILGYPELQCQPFFAFAGNSVAFCTMCVDLLVKKIALTEKQKGDIPAELSKEVRKIHQEYSHMYPAPERLILELLIVLRYPGAKLAVFKVEGPVLTPFAATGVDCIGVGVPVAWPMISQLYTETMTLSQVDRAVMYTLFQSKRYSPNVGGDSEILFFRDNYPKFGHIPVSAESVRIFQETLATFQEAARPILLNYDNVEENTVVFMHHLKRFERAMLKARSKQMREWKRLNKDTKILRVFGKQDD